MLDLSELGAKKPRAMGSCVAPGDSFSLANDAIMPKSLASRSEWQNYWKNVLWRGRNDNFSMFIICTHFLPSWKIRNNSPCRKNRQPCCENQTRPHLDICKYLCEIVYHRLVILKHQTWLRARVNCSNYPSCRCLELVQCEVELKRFHIA